MDFNKEYYEKQIKERDILIEKLISTQAETIKREQEKNEITVRAIKEMHKQTCIKEACIVALLVVVVAIVVYASVMCR